MRLVAERRGDYETEYAAIRSIARSWGSPGAAAADTAYAAAAATVRSLGADQRAAATATTRRRGSSGVDRASEPLATGRASALAAGALHYRPLATSVERPKHSSGNLGR